MPLPGSRDNTRCHSGASRDALDASVGNSQDGFVLVTVLGALLLLTIIASTFTMATRTQVKLRYTLGTAAELAAFSDGLVWLTALRVSESKSTNASNTGLVVNGEAMYCRDGDVLADIRVTDTAGLIDLNATSQDVLSTLLRGLEVPIKEADVLAASIQDFRDPDDIATIGGSEVQIYRAAGRSHGPKNGPFDSVDELDQVLGMTPQLLHRLRPLVTVHSRSPGIDPTVAPTALLVALSRGASSSPPQSLETFTRDQFKLPPQLFVRPNPRAVSRTRVRAFVIDVSVGNPRGARAQRTAVIELSTQSELGFVVREWNSRANPLLPVFGASQEIANCTTAE